MTDSEMPDALKDADNDSADGWVMPEALKEYHDG